eukprot:2814092-Prymnesium_polylepis.1
MKLNSCACAVRATSFTGQYHVLEPQQSWTACVVLNSTASFRTHEETRLPVETRTPGCWIDPRWAWIDPAGIDP